MLRIIRNKDPRVQTVSGGVSIGSLRELDRKIEIKLQAFQERLNYRENYIAEKGRPPNGTEFSIENLNRIIEDMNKVIRSKRDKMGEIMGNVRRYNAIDKPQNRKKEDPPDYITAKGAVLKEKALAKKKKTVPRRRGPKG